MQFCRKISDLHNQFFIYFSFTLKVFELQRPTIYPKIAFYSCRTKNPQKYCNDLLVAMVLPPKLCKMCGLPPNFERIRFLRWNSSSSYEVSNKWNACKQRGSGVYGLCITRTDAFVWCLGTTTTMWYHKSKKLPWSFQADVFFRYPRNTRRWSVPTPLRTWIFGTLLLFFHHKSESVKLHKLTEQMWN